jgi:hypothetical protein
VKNPREAKSDALIAYVLQEMRETNISESVIDCVKKRMKKNLSNSEQ